MARAVYQEKDIYLMDDPISALDAHVRKNIIRKVIMGNLKDKTRILVTHAIDFLELADRVVVLEKGEIKVNGHFNDIKSHPIISKLLEINSINNEHTTQNCQKKEQKEETNESDDSLIMDSSEEIEEAFEKMGRVCD